MNEESESSIKKYRRLGKNTFLIFIGNIGSKLVNLILLPFYTQWLSPEEYGKTELIITYSTIVFWVVSCSIFDSVFVFPKDQSEEKKKEYFTSALLFGVVSILLCSAVSSVTYSIGTNAGWRGFIFENIWQIFGIMSLMYVQTLVQEFVRAIDKFAVYSITGIVQAGVITVFSFLLIPHYGVRGFVFAYAIGYAVAALYSFLFSRAYVFFDLRCATVKSTVEMLRYSLPLVPNGIMAFFLGLVSLPVLESFIGLTAVGLYSMSCKIARTVNILPSIFQKAWLTSAIEESNDKRQYSRFYNNVLKGLTVTQGLGMVFIMFAARIYIRQCMSVEYHDAYQYIPILLMGYIFCNMAEFAGSNFVIVKKSKYYFYSTFWSACVNTALNFILIPVFSIWGACLAFLIAQSVNLFLRIMFSKGIVPITDVSFYVKNGALSAFCVFFIHISSPEIDFLILALSFLSICIINLKIIKSLISKAMKIWKLT